MENIFSKLKVPPSEITKQTLYMQVFDWDRFSKNDGIGEVKLQLGYFDLSKNLKEQRQLMPYSGKPKPISMASQTTVSSTRTKSASSLPREKPSSNSSSDSSSDDEKKSRKPPTGPSMIHYRIAYDRNYQSLKVTVVECKVGKKIKLRKVQHNFCFRI